MVINFQITSCYPVKSRKKTSLAAQLLVQLIQESWKQSLDITQSTKLLQGPFCQELVLLRAPHSLCYFPSETSTEVLGNLSVTPVVLHPAAWTFELGSDRCKVGEKIILGKFNSNLRAAFWAVKIIFAPSCCAAAALFVEEGVGRLSTALHLQAGPTSWTPNLGLVPRKEAGRCRTDAEFKLQIDNNTLRLLISDLAGEEQLGKTRKLHLSAVPCGNCHTACLSISTGRAAPSSCLQSGPQTSAEQVLTALWSPGRKRKPSSFSLAIWKSTGRVWPQEFLFLS